MTEDEVSVNNKMEKEPGIQELSPWMRKRLDDRARPFSPQGLIQLLFNGSKLTKSVVKHTSINDVLSRIRNLGFLSKSYRSIISRAARAEPPNIYRMLDLPWFRGSGDEVPKQRQSSQTYTTEESVNRTIKRQSSEPSIESLVSKQEESIAYVARLMQPPISRTTAITIGNTIGPNPVKSSPSRIEKKPPDYPTRLAELAKNESEIKTGTPSGLSNFNKINIPQDIPKTSGHQPSHADTLTRETSKSSHTAPFETGSYETVRQPDNVNKENSFGITINKGEQANTSRRYTRTDHVGDEIRKIRLIDNPTKIPHSEQTSKAIQPSSMTPAISEKEITIADGTGSSSDIFNSRTKTNNDIVLDTAQYRKTNIEGALVSSKLDSTPIDHTILPDNQGITKFKTVYANQGSSTKDTKHKVASNGKLADNRMDNIKTSGTRHTLEGKDASQRYPAQDLFYKKPLSVGQKILQSLPFIRNFKRKDDKTLKTAPIINERPVVMKDDLSLKEIDLVYTNQEPNTPDIPEKPINAATDAGIASKADVVVLHQASKSNDSTIQKKYPPGEVPKIIKQTVWHESIKRKEASKIYPVKDLVPVRMHSTRQRIIRSLPLIRNWSKADLLVSRAEKKLVESYGSQPSESALEIPRAAEITAAHYTPALFPPNFPSVADRNIISTHYEVLQNGLQRLPDYNGASNNLEIDMVLASDNQTKTTRHRDDNQPLDQLIHLQRDQSPASSQSMVQTQPYQAQTQNTTQTSTTQNVENNTNQKNNQPDIKALAREIYPLIRRMIIIEKERRPSL